MWSLHLGEAKSHDEARIHSLKDDMDGVLIFVRAYISIIVFFLKFMCSGRFILRGPHFLSH
jgi:hypothetical protein